MEYGFIGGGNMAGAIIAGMIKSGINGGDINVYEKNAETAENLKSSCGVNLCLSQKEVIAKSGVIILGVKPNVLDAIIGSVKDDIGEKRPLVISIAVGKTIAYLESALGNGLPIARVMPNINAKALKATSGYCLNKAAGAEHAEIVEKIFGSIGTISEISENLFSVFGAVAGSSPAFAYLYIDTLARAAQKAGMPKKQALEIAASTVLGSAEMVLKSGEHPWELVDQVCSPGGTTIEGIFTLEDNGFESTVIKAVDAVLAKDLKIQGK